MTELSVVFDDLTDHCSALDSSMHSLDDILMASRTASTASTLAFGLICSPFFLAPATLAQGTIGASAQNAQHTIAYLRRALLDCRDDFQEVDREAAERLGRLLRRLEAGPTPVIPVGGATP